MNIVSLLTELTDTKKIMFKSLTYSNSFDDDPSNFVLAISYSTKVTERLAASLTSVSRDLVPVMCIDV